MTHILAAPSIALMLLLARPGLAAEAIEQTAERGPVIAILRIEPAEPVIGDVVTLEFEVRAEPDVRHMNQLKFLRLE